MTDHKAALAHPCPDCSGELVIEARGRGAADGVVRALRPHLARAGTHRSLTAVCGPLRSGVRSGPTCTSALSPFSHNIPTPPAASCMMHPYVLGGIMHVRTTTAAAAVITAALLLTGCSSSDDSKDEPSKPTPTVAPTTAPAKLNKAEATSRCADALFDKAADDPSGTVGATLPKACEPLSDAEYADAIREATRQVNEAKQKKLQDQIDNPSGTG